MKSCAEASLDENFQFRGSPEAEDDRLALYADDWGEPSTPCDAGVILQPSELRLHLWHESTAF